MSTANETMADRLQGSTPSREAKETPGWVRILGMVGMVAFAASVIMYLYNAYIYTQVLKGPTHVPGISSQEKVSVYPAAIPIFMLGIILMLFQASREQDKTQRRLLGLIGVSIFCLGVLLATNVLVSEAWKQWFSPGPDTNPDIVFSGGKWAGLVATVLMAIILLTAWMAPFVRAAAERPVSFFGLISSWINYLGKPLVSACTLYGIIGIGLLAAIAYLLKDPLNTYVGMILQYSKENSIAYGLGSYILFFLLVGLPFMLVLANTEEEEAWAKMPTSIIGVVGVIAAFFGMVGFCTDLFKVPDFALPYGVTLSLLGLFFTIIFITQRNSESDSAQAVARWTGYAGLIVLIVAAVRSLLPAVVEINWLQDTFASLENINLSSYLVPNGFLYMLLGALFCFVGWLYCSENKLLILTRRELGSFFTSPIGYIVLGATLVVAWFVYNSWVSELVDATNMGGAYPEPVVAPYFFDMFIIIFMMIAIPMMTMRLMSEENRAGTMEIVLTAPVDEFSIVISKFLAGWLYTVLIFMAWAIYPILLRIAGQESFDFRPMMSSLLGLSIVSFGFVAMGVFFSSITKNQIVALLLTFAGMLGMFMIYFVERMMSQGPKADPNSPMFEFLRYISFVHHVFYSFARGKVELKHILFHVSFAAFWLFLTIRVLESRKWR